MSTKITLDLKSVNPDHLELVSELISLACITVLAAALGSKTYGEKIRTINYSRLLVVLLYVLSWASAATSMVIVSTNNENLVSCTLGMFSCGFFYAGSKMITYAWLIERVHLITAVKSARLKTAQDKFNLFFYFVLISSSLLSFRNIYLESDGSCTIGLQDIASIPLLVYDLIFNMYLTWLFIKPLTNIGHHTTVEWKSTHLYQLARRALVASVMYLSVSFLNVLCVVMTHGHQRGVICLCMCTMDVTVNVVTIHRVTTRSRSSHGPCRTDTQVGDRTTTNMTFVEEDTKYNDKSVKLDGSMIEYSIKETSMD